MQKEGGWQSAVTINQKGRDRQGFTSPPASKSRENTWWPRLVNKEP
jgi:hypothetical protein